MYVFIPCAACAGATVIGVSLAAFIVWPKWAFIALLGAIIAGLTALIAPSSEVGFWIGLTSWVLGSLAISFAVEYRKAIR